MKARPLAASALIGAICGGIVVALVALLAGCASNPPPAPAKPTPAPPPLPRAAVILAVEGDNPANLTVEAAAPAFAVAPAPIVKRGRLSLAWNASPGPSIAGYRLYYGTNAGFHYASAAVGNVTNATLTGLDEGQRYFVVATAYDAQGVESAPSNEASGVTPILVSLTQSAWLVSSWGVTGRTNEMQVSTNLTDWEVLHVWIGNGNAVSVIHSNGVQAWFRVEVRP